jgi:hypothetical protein
MVIFNSYVSLPEGIFLGKNPQNTIGNDKTVPSATVPWTCHDISVGNG